MTAKRLAALTALATASGAFAYFYVGRDFPWVLAFVAGLAVGALVYTAVGTLDRLRSEVGDGVSRRSTLRPAPGEEDHRGEKEEMHRPSHDEAGDE